MPRLDVQLDKLKHCDKIYREKKWGPQTNVPNGEYVREGDTLVVTRLDRLARSTLHLCQIADELKRKSVNLQVLDQNMDTSFVLYKNSCRILIRLVRRISRAENYHSEIAPPIPLQTRSSLAYINSFRGD